MYLQYLHILFFQFRIDWLIYIPAPQNKLWLGRQLPYEKSCQFKWSVKKSLSSSNSYMNLSALSGFELLSRPSGKVSRDRQKWGLAVAGTTSDDKDSSLQDLNTSDKVYPSPNSESTNENHLAQDVDSILGWCTDGTRKHRTSNWKNIHYGPNSRSNHT